MTEYEFTLPDGSKRYEFVGETADMRAFMKMHGATAAKPVAKGTPLPTGFDQAIADASNPDHRNYSPALTRRIRAEKRIATALVAHALERGYRISVNDGEDWPVKRSSDKAEIMAALFSTDEDWIHLRTSGGDKVGWFRLIYGNDGYDVVSDYSANETCEAIWQGVIRPLADRIEEGR